MDPDKHKFNPNMILGSYYVIYDLLFMFCLYLFVIFLVCRLSLSVCSLALELWMSPYYLSRKWINFIIFWKWMYDISCNLSIFESNLNRKIIVLSLILEFTQIWQNVCSITKYVVLPFGSNNYGKVNMIIYQQGIDLLIVERHDWPAVVVNIIFRGSQWIVVQMAITQHQPCYYTV